jgi:hypothetical protein
MHMLLLIGISVAFVLSTLHANTFYSEKTFTSSTNHWRLTARNIGHAENLWWSAVGSIIGGVGNIVGGMGGWGGGGNQNGGVEGKPSETNNSGGNRVSL